MAAVVAAPAPVKSADDWKIKESRTHPGTFYRYNPKTGSSEWLTPATLANGAQREQLAASKSDRAPSKARPVSAPADRATAVVLNESTDSHAGQIFVHGKHRRPHTASTLRRDRVPIRVHLPDGTKIWVDSKKNIANVVSDKMGEHVSVSELSFGSDDRGDKESVSNESYICNCECNVYEPVPFEGNSRYREDYPKHPLHFQRSEKPVRVVASVPTDPDQFVTKYHEDFKAFQPDPPQSMKPKSFTPAHIPFEGITTHKASFYPKPVKCAPQRRPPSPARVTAPFEGTTTHRTAHIPFPESRPRDSMAPSNRKLITAPFEGVTQYTKDYIPLPLENTRKKRLQQDPWEYGPPREFNTEHRDQFVPKRAPAEKKPCKCKCRKSDKTHHLSPQQRSMLESYDLNHSHAHSH